MRSRRKKLVERGESMEGAGAQGGGGEEEVEGSGGGGGECGGVVKR